LQSIERRAAPAPEGPVAPAEPPVFLDRDAALAQAERALVRARADAAVAHEDKARFLAMMNHEVRTPMNGVLAVAELLRRQPLNTDALSLVDAIVESASALQRMLEDALDVGRGDGAALLFHPEPVRPAALLDEAHGRWTAPAERQATCLAVSYDGDPELAVAADPVRLAQVPTPSSRPRWPGSGEAAWLSCAWRSAAPRAACCYRPPCAIAAPRPRPPPWRAPSRPSPTTTAAASTAGACG